MKLVFSFLVFLAVSAWSAVGDQWTELVFQEGFLDIDSTVSPNVDTVYVSIWHNKVDAYAYYSTLDTNYMVFSDPRTASIRVYCTVPADSVFTSFKFPHSLTEVLRYEFMKWHEWGFLGITKDSAQRLIDLIVPDSLDVRFYRIFYGQNCLSDPASCRSRTSVNGGGGTVQDDFSLLPQKKILAGSAEPAPADTSAKDPIGEQPKDTSASVGKQPADTSASVGDSSGAAADSSEKSLRILDPATFMAQSVMPGMRYRVFDLNGVYLYDGIWQGSLKTVGSTRIVRFENGKTVIFR